MKLVPLALAAFGLSAGILASGQSDSTLIVITGDLRGYLSPCGCSDPMMGGIKRRATVIRQITRGRQAVLLDNGGNVSGAGRQDEMKAETIAQAMAELGATALNFGPSEAALGRGSALQTSRLANDRMTSLAVSEPQSTGLVEYAAGGPFLVAGAAADPASVAGPLGRPARPLKDSLTGFLAAADQAEAIPILLLQGNHDQAASIARDFPKLGLIVYSAMGQPSSSPERIGTTLLVTPGERGKNVLTLEARNGVLSGYRAIPLGPEIKDDATVARFYDAYLRRVESERLLERLPRQPTAGYAGAWACASCHPAAMKVWKRSAHRNAFGSIDSKGHGADPDCVSCHVVGLSSTRGFKSLAQTPHLAGVGCESCHGPSLDHAKNPKRVHSAKASAKTCLPCHNTDNSPNFEFEAYWRKVRH